MKLAKSIIVLLLTTTGTSAIAAQGVQSDGRPCSGEFPIRMECQYDMLAGDQSKYRSTFLDSTSQVIVCRRAGVGETAQVAVGRADSMSPLMTVSGQARNGGASFGLDAILPGLRLSHSERQLQNGKIAAKLFYSEFWPNGRISIRQKSFACTLTPR